MLVFSTWLEVLAYHTDVQGCYCFLKRESDIEDGSLTDGEVSQYEWKTQVHNGNERGYIKSLS